VTADLHGTPIFGHLEIEQQGRKITGQFFGDELEGTVDGSAVHFVSKDNSGGTKKVDGTVKNGVLSAAVIDIDEADEAHPDHYSMSASLIPINKERLKTLAAN
jgi:amidase